MIRDRMGTHNGKKWSRCKGHLVRSPHRSNEINCTGNVHYNDDVDEELIKVGWTDLTDK
jgi:hypothetical protein